MNENQRIYDLFREQDRWLKFGEFLENGIEWIEEPTLELQSNGGVDED